MKRLAYIFLAFFATAAVFSCQEEAAYEPGPQASGAQYYFSSDEATSVTISHTTQSVSVNLFRVETGSASTATVSIADESGLISSASSATANFAAGSNKATLTFPITPSDWEFAKDYKVTYTVFDETTPYGKSELAVTYKYPTPLTKLGTATLTEGYFTGKTFTPTVYRSDLDPNEYHIQKFMGSKSADLIIHVTKPGDTFGNITFTQADLVYFDDTYIGLSYYDVYPDGGSPDQLINCDHPAGFKKYASDESKWVGSKVVLYQDNGIPAIVEIAPYYYIDGLGGWDKTQVPALITIIFPGYDPKDYAVEAEYTGLFTDAEGALFGEASVLLGADIESAVAVAVRGDSDEAIEAGIALLASEDESVVPVTESTVRVPLPTDEPGLYTIIVGGIAEGEIQEVAVATFSYTPGEVIIDWDWLTNAWRAQDYNLSEGAAMDGRYDVSITKVDETHCKVSNLWGTEGVFEGVVDFEAMTITFAGDQFACKDAGVGGDLYFVAVDPKTEYDVYEDLTTPVVAQLMPEGIIIQPYDFLIKGGRYDGYTYVGGIATILVVK